MKGRKPTPIEVLKLKGTMQPCRHSAAQGPQAHAGTPTMPDWLTDAAREAWGTFLPLLEARNVLTVADATGLAILCTTFAEWRELSAQVASEGRTFDVVTKAGGTMVRANPKVGMLADAHKRLNAALAEHGLTPAMRLKVGAVGDPNKPNKFADLGKVS